MRRLLKAIFMILGVSCIAVLIYFIVIIIGSKGEVVKQYKNMTSASTQGADNIHANFLRVYGTYGEELFIQLGLKKTDYAINGTSDSDSSMPGDKIQSGCTCTSLCTSDSDYDDTCDVCAKDWTQCAYVSPCTCAGPDRCTSSNVDDTCEACKISYTNCVVSTGTVTPGSLGGTYEGVWTHCRQCSETYVLESSEGSQGVHCFLIAMNCLASGLSGSTVTIDEIFAADGATLTNTGKIDKSTGKTIVKSSKNFKGGLGRANDILRSLNIQTTLTQSSEIDDNGTYLVYVVGDTSKQFSGSGYHWFVINNKKVMCKAGPRECEKSSRPPKTENYSLTDTDIEYIEKYASHIYKAG